MPNRRHLLATAFRYRSASPSELPEAAEQPCPAYEVEEDLIMRTGKEYLESLRDGRTVIVDGERVQDVTAHPAFAGIAATVAQMYDFAGDPTNGMTAIAPETGREALKPFMIPRTPEDLRDRREAISRWAQLSHGFVGRGPDHVAAFLAGFASHSEAGSRQSQMILSSWSGRLASRA